MAEHLAARRRKSLAKPLVGLALLGVIAALALRATNQPAEEPEPVATRAGAISVCHQAVEEQLKAPATAEFSGEQATAGGLRSFRVVGYVDAENGFGAMLRLEWSCYAIWLSGTKWSTEAVVTE